ncbi:MAG: DUF465 domain-containing protein [Alphaproteobacteria bacterium]
MSIEQRIESLRYKHALLDKKLTDETSRPMPDESLLLSLKKQKLQIKDEIQTLQT